MMEPVDIIQEVISNKQGWVNGEKYMDNARWLKDHLEEVKEQYKGQAIVVRDLRVIFNSRDPRQVREKLRSFDPIQRNQSYIFYIPNDKEMVLW